MTQKKYRPSNGTEGMCFIEKWCDNCIHEKYNHTMNDNDKKCDILSRSMIYDLKDKEYPNEWVQDENGARCTAWTKWDWGNDGDPDDRDNPKTPIPDDPNQLVMPFIFDEIEVKKKQELILN